MRGSVGIMIIVLEYAKSSELKFYHNKANRNSRYHSNLLEVIFHNYNTTNEEYHVLNSKNGPREKEKQKD